MKVAFLHYHLKPGGVTTVIRHQAAALQNDVNSLILTNGPAPEGFDAPHVRVDGLGYDDPIGSPPSSRQTAEAIERAIRGRWQDGCDLIHVHNPLLCKNSRLLEILEILKENSHSLFLQVHDFAEDGRPWSYYRNGEYPSDCHYGVLNSRDYAALNASGLSGSGIHLLPNMIDPHNVAGSASVGNGSLVLYPVRAIRRKNIGEALLLSLFFGPDRPLAITLPPNSPRDWKIHEEWKAYAARNSLNVRFDASLRQDYAALVNSAGSILSTSISEGFGFVFLEPWIAGKPLTGRRLPHIDRDFAANGVRLDHLYEELSIPLEWIGAAVFRNRWRDCLRRTLDYYGAFLSEAEIEDGYRILTGGDTIDFAMLDEPIQRRVIDRLLPDPAARDFLLELNPFLSRIADPPLPDERIADNREAVLRAYSREAYRQRLLDIYRQVTTVPVRHRIDRKALLRRFLRPETFGLLKWCDDAV